MDQHQRIEELRKHLGDKLLILGHHYQKSDVLEHCDLRGDSFQLSAAASERTGCESIVFCGVHFMAETADILANSPDRLAARKGKFVNVLLPDPTAGCSMADLATIEQVERCWKELSDHTNLQEIVPITYVNSSAALKAFCGRNGGIACTSSNAAAVLDWALSRSRQSKVLFFPDQHLGRNTAILRGIPPEEMPVWNPELPLGGVTPESIRQSQLILWNGYCCVHQHFQPCHIEAIRKKHPGICVIVHPECCREVVEQSDMKGSTSFILQKITESPAGSQWAVGTEGRMVQRLIEMFPDKMICNLADMPSLCETMDRITSEKLLISLESIAAGKPQNIIRVEPIIANDARICLERMLECKYTEAGMGSFLELRLQ